MELDANVQIYTYNKDNKNQKWKIIKADNALAKNAVTREVSDISMDLVIYPNPVVEVLNIANLDQDASILIFDSNGRTVVSKIIHEKDINKTIDVTMLQDGMYFISMNGLDPVKFYKN